MNLPGLTYRRFCTEDLLEFPNVRRAYRSTTCGYGDWNRSSF